MRERELAIQSVIVYIYTSTYICIRMYVSMHVHAIGDVNRAIEYKLKSFSFVLLFQECFSKIFS